MKQAQQLQSNPRLTSSMRSWFRIPPFQLRNTKIMFNDLSECDQFSCSTYAMLCKKMKSIKIQSQELQIIQNKGFCAFRHNLGFPGHLHHWIKGLSVWIQV
jgi:hypothetical protein